MRVGLFWTFWILGTLALAFVWLFGHVPRASALILGAVNGIALGLLMSSVLLGKRSWQVRNLPGNFPESEPSPHTAMKITTMLAYLQSLASLYWLADLVIHELRH
jgi:hypothetical protein